MATSDWALHACAVLNSGRRSGSGVLSYLLLERSFHADLRVERNDEYDYQHDIS